MMELLARTPSVQYPQIAGLYDRLKAGDDYDTWVALLQGPIVEFGNGGRRLLDVGCGTGLSSRPFLSHGFTVTACDVSTEMLAVATANPRHHAVTFALADMRDLPDELGSFDVITWMDDVANHLPTPSDLCAALSSSAARLADGGLLIFDVNTLIAFREMFADTAVFEHDGVVFAFAGQTPDPVADGVAHTKLTAFHRSGDAWARVDADLRQTHFSHEAVGLAIHESGLRLISVRGLHGIQLVDPAREDAHHKTVYFCTRA